MAKNLVIVESPAKARTVGRFLGNKYLIKASLGHIRDLPKGHLGVKVEDDFRPEYRVLPNKRDLVKELKQVAQEASAIYLATDPDREGEAISWHLIQATGLGNRNVHRVVFHELTEEAIKEAFRQPRDIDMRLVNAQQARRVLDRLVGYRLSPLLWSKVRGGLSAGRVQSVALRIVVEREREIDAFIPKEYWGIEAELAKERKRQEKSPSFKASLHSIQGQKGRLHVFNEKQAEGIVSDLGGSDYTVHSVTKKEVRSRPAPPFITSTLQQEAGRRLRFTAKKTMLVAQQLYEGLAVGSSGPEGLITYMRTDSTHVASAALKEANEYIRRRFGNEYAPKAPRIYSAKVKGAQEAHEAIRPTSIEREPDAVKPFLNTDQLRLYDLIWKRMLASQMADAVSDSTSVEIDALSRNSGKVYRFRASGSVLKFPGFRIVYIEERDEPQGDEEGKAPLPELSQGEMLKCMGITPEQHFTKPPPRYTESSLIKALEEKGIGRPSTYAPIISTLIDRIYVQKERGQLVPTKLGGVVTDLLTTHFPQVMDTGFTAHMEEELDDVAQGEREWPSLLSGFYTPFSEAVEKARQVAERVPREQIDEETQEVCDKCGQPMVIKTGRFGRFLACKGYPECRNTRPFAVKIGVECPRCHGDIVERRQRGKRGRLFYGCSNYPTCNFVINRRPVPQPCPQCGELLVASGKSTTQCTACKFRGKLLEEEPVEALV